jgi:hypothetical protein
MSVYRSREYKYNTGATGRKFRASCTYYQYHMCHLSWDALLVHVALSHLRVSRGASVLGGAVTQAPPPHSSCELLGTGAAFSTPLNRLLDDQQRAHTGNKMKQSCGKTTQCPFLQEK